MSDKTPFVIAPLDNRHNRSSFCCGTEALDLYLLKHAGQEARKYISATFVLVKPSEQKTIIGYYTLSATGVDMAGLPQTIVKKLPKYPLAPATLLGRLAVSRQFQKQGFGETLLLDALRRSLKSEIAFMAVVVDAKDDCASAFYKNYEFLEFSDNPHKLFLPMTSVRKLF